MTLHFEFKQVQALMQHSLQAREHKKLTFDPDSGKPGLILAGDEGVYFTSNGRPALFVDPDDPAGPVHRCAYAMECDPSKDPEGCRRNKEEAFGVSDGAEFVPYESEDAPCIKHWLEANEGNSLLVMELAASSMSLIGSELRPIQAGAVQRNAGDEFLPAFAEGIKWRAWEVPVVAMDRRGLIAYIGALKQRLALAEQANKTLTAVYGRQIEDLKTKYAGSNNTKPRSSSRKAGALVRPANASTRLPRKAKGAADTAPKQHRA